MKEKIVKRLGVSLVFLAGFCSCGGANSTGQPSDSSVTQELADSQEDKPLPDIETELVCFYDRPEIDIPKIEGILKKSHGISDLNNRIVAITQEFIGTPYGGGTLNIPKDEQLYVSTSKVDCIIFVEMVMAMAKASEKDNAGITDFESRLRSLRYRNGQIDGYPSRLHYLSDWAIDNERRGNLMEITSQSPFSQQRSKTIDYMTTHRDLYPALSNDSIFDAIKETEVPLKDLKFSIIPASKVNLAAEGFLKSGDIVAIVTDKESLDVSHVGIVNMKGNIPYLIHASSKYKKVVNDTVSLKDYLQRQKSPGIRIFRTSPD